MDQRTVDHLARSKHDRDLAYQLIHHLQVGPAADRWAIVAAFYAAVHLINGYVWEKQRKTVDNHATRARHLHSDPDLCPIIPPYQELYDWSRIARYSERPIFTSNQAQDALDDAYKIDRRITRLLAQP